MTAVEQRMVKNNRIMSIDKTVNCENTMIRDNVGKIKIKSLIVIIFGIYDG